MLTLEEKRPLDADDVLEGKFYIRGSCLSTDEKPTGCKNGSRLIEMDTGKRYAFDEDNSTWLEDVGGEFPSSIAHALYFDNNGKSFVY